MKYLGVLVGILLLVSFASIGIFTQAQLDTSSISESYGEDSEENGSFEKSEIWTEDHGVTFKYSTSQNTSADMDEKGNLDVGWEDNRTGEWNIFYVKLRNRDGQKLINDFRVTDNERPSLNPKITSREDYIYLVWQEKNDEGIWELYFSKLHYSDEEITFVEGKEREYLLDLGEGQSKEYSFIDGKNEGEDSYFYLVYEREEGNQQDIYYTKIDEAGEIESGPHQITDSHETSYMPQIRAGRTGNIHIFWLEPVERNNGLFYKQIDSESDTEVGRKRLTVVNRLTRYDLTLDEEGNIHLIFDDDRYHDYKRDVIYQRLDESGKIITDDSLVTQRDDENNSFSPSITLGKQDEIYISWADSRDHRSSTEGEQDVTKIPHSIYMTTIDEEEGEKIRPTERVTGTVSFSANPIMITDGDNEQHLLWEDDRREAMDIYYKRTHKPDLAVEKMFVEPTKPLYNSTVRAEVMLNNSGDSRIETSGSLYMEEEDVLLGEVNISLEPREEKSAFVEFITREKGEQTLTFVANEERDKIERDYGNNRYQTTFVTRYYDLSMARIKGNATVEPGESGTFQYNVTNEGNFPQKIEVEANITGPEEGIEIDHPPVKDELEINETIGYEFNATTQQDQLAGEYTIQVTINSLDAEEVYVTENFTLTVEPVYDISLYIAETTISDPADMNYTVDITVTNRANTDQEILVYVGKNNEYAHIERGMMILEPGESRNPILNLTGYHLIEGEELEITVIAESQDDENVTESQSVLIEGEEIDESLLAAIPWFWIGVAIVLIVGFFIAVRVVYALVSSR